MTGATLRKREQLLEFVQRKIAVHREVQAVVVVGSVATGKARPDSDVDAFVFFDPLDLYIVPAESVWRKQDDTFHSIFSDVGSHVDEGLQLDLHRVDLGRWRDRAYVWPEAVRAELADGWIGFDRDGEVGRLIADRTAVPEAERQRLIDDALTWGDALTANDEPSERWISLGAADAADRLQAAYEDLVQGLFAYNRKWRPWRTREMTALLRLDWLPDNFGRRVMMAAISGGHDLAAYGARADALRDMFAELLEQLRADATYGDDPLSEAFIRSHDEPGRAWNIDAWNTEHHKRVDPTPV